MGKDKRNIPFLNPQAETYKVHRHVPINPLWNVHYRAVHILFTGHTCLQVAKQMRANQTPKSKTPFVLNFCSSLSSAE